MKEPYTNPGEDDSLDAAIDGANALETEIIDEESLLDEENDDSDEDEGEDNPEEEGELPEYYDPDANDHEFPDEE